MSAIATANSVFFTQDALTQWEDFRSKVSSALADEEVRASFESLSAFLQNSTIIRSCMELLKASRCSIIEKPSPRTLLASLMLALFPSEVIEIDEEELQRLADADEESLDAQCWQSAKSLVAVFSREGAPLQTLLESLKEFQEVFSRWKEHDRTRLLRQLGNSHHQWAQSLQYLEQSRDVAKNKDSVAQIIFEVTRQMEANKRRILQLGGPQALEQILSQPPVQIDLDQLIQEVGSRRYWQEFTEELRASPPVYTRVVTLLKEIRDRLAALLPNRPDLQQTIRVAIDVDFVQQMMETGAIDGAEFLNVFLAIWKNIQNMQAAADDADWVEFRDEVMQEATSGAVTWDELLPKIFNRFLKQLDKVESATAHFRVRMQGQSQPSTAPSTPSQ